MQDIYKTEKDPAEINRDMSRADNYLSGYKINRHLFKLENYERRKSLESEWEAECPGELPMARARMFDIRHRILSLPNGDEKLILYYHYVKGEPIEKCGEMLGISRSSAFRLRRRALCLFAAKALDKDDQISLY